jgi:thioredoxin 1
MKIEKYGAAWCGPCKMLDKTLDQVPKEIEIVKFDADEDEELFVEKGIKSVPVLIFYDDNGNEVKRLIGAVALHKIMDIVKSI